MRIGNTVGVKGIEEEQHIEGLYYPNDVKVFGNMVINDIDDLEPIKLTQEWLIKFGFEKSKANKNSRITYYTLKHLQVIIDSYGFSTSALNPIGSNGLHLNRIEFVHELENLYFDLIREELILKDKT